jgi:phosphatidylinositol alpha-1,6-mannosyltransferase
VLPNLTPAERFTLPKLARALPVARRLLADCDLIHSTVEPFAPLAAWAAGSRPALFTAHGTYALLPVTARRPANWLYRRAFLRADAILCVSRYTEARLRAILPLAQTRVIPNGVDAQKLEAQLAQAERYPKTGPLVLALGALKPRRGTLHLVRAMARVRRDIPDARCVIVGRDDFDPAYTAQVQAEIAAHGLDDGAVTLAGFDPDPLAPARWYKTADVFAGPSLNIGGRFEGFGLVYLEAGLAGLSVIGTRDCGAEDAIDDGITGLLVSQARIDDELPNALIALLRDPARRTAMGAAGRAKARAQTWARAAEAVQAAYAEALG